MRCVTAATLGCVMLLARGAAAQQMELGWGLGLSTGLERSERLSGEPFRRARTRLFVPLDFRVDEFPQQGFGAVGFAEIEPHASLGGEFRWMRWLSPAFVGFVGVTGVLAPETLLGADVGFQVHLPLGKSTSVFIEPEFAAIPFGSDLPGDKLLLWALLGAGFHAN